MTGGQSSAPGNTVALGNTLGNGRLCACGRTARRDRETCWFCAPDVPAELKREARGGRRKALPSGTSDPDLSTADSRRAFREALAGAVLRDELSPELAGIAARLVDGQAKEEQQRPAPPPAPLVVEVARFGNGHEAHS